MCCWGPGGSALLDDYDREQRAFAEYRERPGRLVLPDLLSDRNGAYVGRAVLAGLAGWLPGLPRRLAEASVDTGALPMAGASDRAYEGPWRMPGRLGPWRGGRRLPSAAARVLLPAQAEMGRRHVLLPIGYGDPVREASLARALRERLGVASALIDAPVEAPWRVRSGPPALALIRPDRQVVALYSV